MGGYDENLDVWGYEDWELWIRLLKNGCRVRIVPELLFNYRVVPGTSGGKTMANIQQYDAERLAYIRSKHVL